MEDVLQKKPHERSISLWKRIIRDNVRFNMLRKSLHRGKEIKRDTKGLNKHNTLKNSQFDHHSSQRHECLKMSTNQKRPVNIEEIPSDKPDKLCKKTVHTNAYSPESNRRNAICEVIEKQCIDHVCHHEVNLHQRRDCLRVEYVLREVCLL